MLLSYLLSRITFAGVSDIDAVIKEGGKRSVEIEGAADMGGLQFFCTSMDQAQIAFAGSSSSGRS